jgi:hypothetical protein
VEGARGPVAVISDNVAELLVWVLAVVIFVLPIIHIIHLDSKGKVR